MTGIKLTERIRYMHCNDEDSSHGILILLGNKNHPTRTWEVTDKADFRKGYQNFVTAEITQNDRDIAMEMALHDC